MDVQRPAHAHDANADRSCALENKPQPLFTCQIQDDTSTPAEAICHACLQALDRLAEDAFYTADVASQEFASGKLRPVGRRLDGLRLRLQIWMLDVGLDTTGVTAVPQSPNDYFERAAGGKVRTISQSCKTVASCLKGMCEDFYFMAFDLETAGRERVNSALWYSDRINVTLDNVEAMLHSLTGLVNPILMARALRTGTGRYSEVHHQLRTIMRGASSLDAPYSSELGNDVAFMDEDRLSSSSGDSVFNIEPATQEADPPRSSGSQKAPATFAPRIQFPTDPHLLKIHQQFRQGTREMIEIDREDQREIQEKGKVEEGQRKRQEIDKVEEDQQQRRVKDKGEVHRWRQSLRQQVKEMERKAHREMQKRHDKYKEELERKREEKGKSKREDQRESQEKGQIEPNYQQQIH